MTTPAHFIADWQCSTSLLNETVNRKFQHASMHNPIKNTQFLLEKKRNAQQNGNQHDVLFRGNKYKLPIVRSNQRKENLKGTDKENQAMEDNKSMELSHISWKPLSKFDSMMTTARESQIYNHPSTTHTSNLNNSNDPKHKLYKFKQIFQRMFRFGQRDRNFSYYYQLINQICISAEESEEPEKFVASLLADMSLLIVSIDKNKSVLNVIKKITVFKKSSRYFQFKRPQIRLLYHILCAQLQFYEKNLQKCIKQLQLCQYYSRKQGMQNLTLCFLWQMAQINIWLLKYQQADQNLRNLLEMAVICRQKKAIKYAFQKISVIYYYRGNAIMGQYYLNKSQKGLTQFQTQMYYKEYSHQDQLKRLQNKLFNFPLQQKIIKRKNNPKYESDIWRESKEDHEKQMTVYMDSVNSMMKDHQHAKLGREIKRIAKKMGGLGVFAKKGTEKKEENRGSLAELSQNKGNKRILRNSSTEGIKQQENGLSKEGIIQDNITKVIKTHLSMNRENNSISREQRWRKFITFVFTIQAELKELDENNNNGAKETGINFKRTLVRLKTLNNEKES